MTQPPDLSSLASELVPTIPDAMMLIDHRRARILDMNQAMGDMLQISPAYCQDNVVDPADFIHEDDQGAFLGLGDPGNPDARSGVYLRLRNQDPDDEDPVFAECFGRFVSRPGEDGYWVYYFRPVKEELLGDGAPGEKLSQEKKRTVEALKSSLRIYQLTEKVRAAPKLSTLLLDVRNEDELFRRAGDFLVSEGLNYQEAAILLLDGQMLSLRYTSSDRSRMTYDVQKKNRYARFLLEGIQPTEYDNVQLVALRTKDKPMGVLEVVFDPRERALFNENTLIVEWNNDILETIAEILALFLENIRLYQKLRKQTMLDPLTSVYNRHFLLNQLEKEIDGGQPLSLIFTDVDGFKGVNDTYGHHNGDLIIQEVAFLLQNALRENDLICRYGGDEFVILMPDTDQGTAVRRAEELREIIEEHRFRIIDRESGATKVIQLTISLGVSTTGLGSSAHTLLQQADLALYGAKGDGKNCVYRISEEGDRKSRLEIIDET